MHISHERHPRAILSPLLDYEAVARPRASPTAAPKRVLQTDPHRASRDPRTRTAARIPIPAGRPPKPSRPASAGFAPTMPQDAPRLRFAASWPPQPAVARAALECAANRAKPAKHHGVAYLVPNYPLPDEPEHPRQHQQRKERQPTGPAAQPAESNSGRRGSSPPR